MTPIKYSRSTFFGQQPCRSTAVGKQAGMIGYLVRKYFILRAIINYKIYIKKSVILKPGWSLLIS